MNTPERKVELSPPQEGLVGAAVGGVLGAVLWLAGIISPIAIAGVAAGVGLGSWFNARRRSKRSAND